MIAGSRKPDFTASKDFWAHKRVFITGHTGFKGSWLVVWLSELGALVRGYALAPSTEPSMFNALRLDAEVEHVVADVRDAARLGAAVREFEPEIVIHLAAQPLVRRSYQQLMETFSTNVQGTVNLLDACRDVDTLRAVVVVTTDKCYEENTNGKAYREEDRLGGRDPYSASKACAELVTAAYREAPFRCGQTAVATARAGNVFGGGDWSEDRLIPDAIRAFQRGEPLLVRNPSSVRPWQHVSEPLGGYLALARALYERGHEFAKPFNFGPLLDQTASVMQVADLFSRCWGQGATWIHQAEPFAPREASVLWLDSSRARSQLGWIPRTSIAEGLQHTASWYRTFYEHASPEALLHKTIQQITTISQEGIAIL